MSMPLFDPQSLPWTTTWNDWALCLIPDDRNTSRVWVEHTLIEAMTTAERFSEEYHDVFVAIGGRVATLLRERPGLIIDGTVRPITFTKKPHVKARIGSFGGEIFAFLAKPEFEK